MKAVQAKGFGPPEQMVACVDLPDPAPPGPKEVAIEMLAMSINPADLLTIEGRYAVKPEPPFIPGAEGVGRIAALGEPVEGMQVGDIVVPLGGNCWRETMVSRASAVVRLPGNVSLVEAAMLKANPATAEVMLSDIVDLAPGDWVLMNAGNSAVCRFVRIIAKDRGIKTISVVRREGLEAELTAEGGDAVVVNGGDADALAAAVGEHCGEKRPKLAFDAIGGAATNALAAALAEGGTVVNYGLLSGENCQVDPHHLVFRDVTLKGFWLAPWFQTAGAERIKAVYGGLVERLVKGQLKVPVDSSYPLEDCAKAMTHANSGGRGGKILFTTDAGRATGHV